MHTIYKGTERKTHHTKTYTIKQNYYKWKNSIALNALIIKENNYSAEISHYLNLLEQWE